MEREKNTVKIPKEEVDYQKVDTKTIAKLLEANLQTGLSERECASRQKRYGYNEVSEKKRSPVIKFLEKFWGLTPWMLELTIALSWMLGKYIDMYVVGALLLLNAILGFSQERKASNAVEMLKKKLHINARVLRDSKWKIVPSKELVPGDIVRVRAGDFVPADLKIFDGDLEVDQSALTGESLSVEKGENDMLFSGSTVKIGEASAVVVLTGSKTYFGKATELVQSAKPKLHTEEVISKVVRWLLIIVVGFLAATVVLSQFQGTPFVEILPLILVLLVSAIPVALPAMFTISMALGSMELVKRGVLITRLNASEDAASMNTLCADKTGTITMNKLSIVTVLPMNGFTEDDVILNGALASQEANHDPIDLAFLEMARMKNLSVEGKIQEEFVPFDPKTRRTEALISVGNEKIRVMKGAVNTIFQLSEIDDESVKKLEERIHDFALKGYRTMAVASGKVSETPKILGVVALYDKPRPDSKKLINELKELGISVKMITGDATPIAKEVAKQVGLGSSTTAAEELKLAIKKGQNVAYKIAERSDVFAEVYPQDKYSIVKILQSGKRIVGMTGDGVNDAPALKQAEVGIAVSNATDVAKSAASAVLTNEGLSNIVDLVKVGRMIYQRILTWIFNKVIKTFQIVVFVSLAFLLTGRYIVSAFDVILLLFVIDFVTLSLSTDNVRWSKKPDTWNINGLVGVAMLLGVMTVFESLGLLYLGAHFFNLFNNMGSLHTFTFAILFYSGMFTVFLVRERGRFLKSKPSKMLTLSISIDMVAVALLTTFGMPGLKPIPFVEVVFVIAYSFVFSLLINDVVKYTVLKKIGGI